MQDTNNIFFTKNSLVIVFLILQINSESLFAFQKSSFLPRNHPIYQRVEYILLRLAYAGNGGLDIPTLKIIPLGNEKGIGAEYVRLPKAQIRIEEKLISLCDNLKEPDDALALIIAHELAHHYQGHNTPQRFAAALKATSENVEAEADYYGIKYCILAGYNVHNVFQDLLNQVYTVYGLPNKVDGYPSKQVRLKINQDQIDYLAPFSFLFHTAKFVFLHKDYKKAGILYKELVDKFPGKEVYFNLGTCYALQALSGTRDSYSVFSYPFEIASESRLDRLRSQLREGQNKEMEFSTKYLELAKNAFQEALKRDPNFYPASISLANIFILRKNPERAIGLLKSMPQKKFKNSFAFQTTLGISSYFLGKFEESKKAFRRALELDPQRGEYNLELFYMAREANFTEIVLRRFQEILDYFWKEETIQENCTNEREKKIASLQLNILDQGQMDFNYSVVDRPIVVKGIKGDWATGYVIELENDQGLSYRILIIETNEAYSGPNKRGIKIGSPLKLLLNQYCNPDEIIYGMGGKEFYHYEKSGLIFTVFQGKVLKWATYMNSI